MKADPNQSFKSVPVVGDRTAPSFFSYFGELFDVGEDISCGCRQGKKLSLWGEDSLSDQLMLLAVNRRDPARVALEWLLRTYQLVDHSPSWTETTCNVKYDRCPD